MAIAFRAATSTAPVSTASLTVTRPTGTVDTDVLLAIISCSDSNPTVTAPAGWVAVRNDTSGTHRYWTFRKLAGASEPASYAFTVPTAETMAAVCVTYSGVDETTPVNVHGAQTGATITTVTAPSVTTTLAACRVVCFHAINKSTTLTTPADTTLRHEAESVDPSMQAVDFDVAVAGVSGNRTSTAGTTGDSLGVQVALTRNNTLPTAPTLLGPVGGVAVDRDIAQTFTWTHNDPEGDIQSARSVRYRLVGAPTWTTSTLVTTLQSLVLAAGTLAAGSNEWQAQTSDAEGYGPWSASSFFTAATAPLAPTIVAPVSGATIGVASFLVEWSTTTQDGGYQLRRVADAAGVPDTATVYYDTGTVTSVAARSRTVAYETNARYEHTQIRVLHGGLWSPWASTRNLVSYTPPAVPTLTVAPLLVSALPVALRVQATHPAPAGGQPAVTSIDIHRRTDVTDTVGVRIAAGLAPTAPFDDYRVASRTVYEFRCRAIATNGTATWSAWVT